DLPSATFLAIGDPLWIRPSPFLKTTRFISPMRIAKQPGAELRFFGSLLQRPGSSRLIAGDGLSPTPTFAGNITPITADNLLVNDWSGSNVRPRSQIGITAASSEQSFRIYHR